MLVRLASQEEIDFYHEVVYPLQDRILLAITEEFGELFYLSGGTALSRFYLQHRLSDDLDLFTPEARIDRAFPKIVELIERLGYKVYTETQGAFFCRLSVSTGPAVLKLDIATEKPLKPPAVSPQGFFLDSFESIAVNKLIAFEDRAHMKDLIDLYFIVSGGMPLEELLAKAEEKRVIVPYEELLTINQQGLTGGALLLKSVSEESLFAFLEEVKRTLSEYIKKKAQEISSDIDHYIKALLWDLPPEERKVSSLTLKLLKERMKKLQLPVRIALEKVI